MAKSQLPQALLGLGALFTIIYVVRNKGFADSDDGYNDYAGGSGDGEPTAEPETTNEIEPEFDETPQKGFFQSVYDGIVDIFRDNSVIDNGDKTPYGGTDPNPVTIYDTFRDDTPSYTNDPLRIEVIGDTTHVYTPVPTSSNKNTSSSSNKSSRSNSVFTSSGNSGSSSVTTSSSSVKTSNSKSSPSTPSSRKSGSSQSNVSRGNAASSRSNRGRQTSPAPSSNSGSSSSNSGSSSSTKTGSTKRKKYTGGRR